MRCPHNLVTSFDTMPASYSCSKCGATWSDDDMSLRDVVELHIFEDRHGRTLASMLRPDGTRTVGLELRSDEVKMLRRLKLAITVIEKVE